MSVGFSQWALHEYVLRRVNFPQRARVHTCLPSHVQGLDRAHTCFPSTTWVKELLHQASEAWGGVCAPTLVAICKGCNGARRPVNWPTLRGGEEPVLRAEVRWGVCVQIRAIKDGDYAVTRRMGGHPTLKGGVTTGAHDSVTSCGMETKGEGATEAVFEEHLQAGAEDAPLFQLQGSQDEVCQGGIRGDLKCVLCPLA